MKTFSLGLGHLRGLVSQQKSYCMTDSVQYDPFSTEDDKLSALEKFLALSECFGTQTMLYLNSLLVEAAIEGVMSPDEGISVVVQLATDAQPEAVDAFRNLVVTEEHFDFFGLHCWAQNG